MHRPFGTALVVLSFAAGLGLAVRGWASLTEDPPADFGPIPAARAAGNSPAPRKAEPAALAEVSDAAFGPAPEIAALPTNDPFGAVRGAQTPPRSAKPARDSDDPFGSLDSYQLSPTRLAKPKTRSNPFTPTTDDDRAADRRAKQARLLTLAREAADLASDAELDRLVADLESTVNEQRAEAELKQARAALERVVAAFPQTDAANAARHMLDRHTEPTPAKITPVEAPR